MIKIYQLITSSKIMKLIAVGLSKLDRSVYQLLLKNGILTSYDLNSNLMNLK